MQRCAAALKAAQILRISSPLAPKARGGAKGNRTLDPLLAKQVLSQLSYGPMLTISRFRTRPNSATASADVGH